MVTLARRAQHIPFAPVVGVLFGSAAAILVAALPQWMFEAAVARTGLPNVVGAAAPPLGLVARLLAMALAFAGVALVSWAACVPLGRRLEVASRSKTPWHDAGYDTATIERSDDAAPARRPIFAPDELGAPLMSDAAIAPIAAAPADLDAKHAEVADPPAKVAAADLSIVALVDRFEAGLARRERAGHGPEGQVDAILPLSHSWIVPEPIETPLAPDVAQGPPQTTNAFRRLALS